MSLEEHYNLHLTFWVCSIFMWILFIWVKFADPGYIKPNRQAYEDAVKMVRKCSLQTTLGYIIGGKSLN